jgi:hypothetical protein
MTVPTAHNFKDFFKNVTDEQDVLIRDDVGNLYRPYGIKEELGVVVIQVQLEFTPDDTERPVT